MTVPPAAPGPDPVDSRGDARGGGGRGSGPGGVVVGAGNARLRTRAWVPGTGPARGRVVIVHGLGEHAGRYADFGSFLATRGLAVLTYDQRGHGASEGRRGVLARFDDLLEDLDCVLRSARAELPGTGEPVLLGHSLGGLVALRYLQTRRPPLPGAVLSAPWLDTAARIPLWKRAALRVLRRFAPRLALSAGLDASLLTCDPEKQREYEEDFHVHDRISAGLYDAVVEAQERAVADSRGPGLPLLVLVPLEDGVADAAATRRYAEALEGDVTVELLEGFRHEPLNDLGRHSVWERVAGWVERRVGAEPASGPRVGE